MTPDLGYLIINQNSNTQQDNSDILLKNMNHVMMVDLENNFSKNDIKINRLIYKIY